MMLKDRNGQEKFKHEEKAALIWEAIKDKLGTSEYTQMHFNINDLLSPVAHLEHLASPFSKEEIDKIVANLSPGKSPGPNGFNTDFLVISSDFYALCAGFYDMNLCLQSINSSFIVMIPKKDNPSNVSDYMPISLLNSSIKLLTKLLANRVQEVILRVVHQNQYGFIRNRSIQDCLVWSFEYLHMCHKSKK
jgi:hypothetical protein